MRKPKQQKSLKAQPRLHAGRSGDDDAPVYNGVVKGGYHGSRKREVA